MKEGGVSTTKYTNYTKTEPLIFYAFLSCVSCVSWLIISVPVLVLVC